ncbi:unnamed protein product, partial [Polarella glacialis]
AVIAIVPGSENGSEECDGKEVKGWLLSCAPRAVKPLLAKFAALGCLFEGLQSHYKLMIDGKSGNGAFSTVVRGETPQGENRALKLMKGKVQRHAVLREADMLNAAQGSGYIIRFHGAFSDLIVGESSARRRWALVFDFHHRGDLYDHVVSRRSLTESQALPLAQNLLHGLAHLGSRGIFHRDVKPENLLISASKNAVLTDFGISTLISDTESLKDTFGSLGYASPEMLQGQSTGCHGDWFGSGVVLYFMLSTSTPFLAPTPDLIKQRTCQGSVRLSYGCFEHTSQDCRDLMLKLMAVDIGERWTAQQALASPCFKALSTRY